MCSGLRSHGTMKFLKPACPRALDIAARANCAQPMCVTVGSVLVTRSASSPSRSDIPSSDFGPVSSIFKKNVRTPFGPRRQDVARRQRSLSLARALGKCTGPSSACSWTPRVARWSPSCGETRRTGCPTPRASTGLARTTTCGKLSTRTSKSSCSSSRRRTSPQRTAS